MVWTVKYSSIMGRPPRDQELANALLELCCHIEAIRATTSRGLGLTPQQAQLLTSVTPAALTHGELASRLHCDKTNVTGLVDRLERRQLVRRRPDPTDRRATLVSLTDDGVELVDRFRASVTASVTSRLGSWPPDRREELATLALTTIDALTNTAPG
jgi:DNA-binding MarR family transcriptional regulator